jgi:hypothetical protein
MRLPRSLQGRLLVLVLGAVTADLAGRGTADLARRAARAGRTARRPPGAGRRAAGGAAAHAPMTTTTTRRRRAAAAPLRAEGGLPGLARRAPVDALVQRPAAPMRPPGDPSRSGLRTLDARRQALARVRRPRRRARRAGLRRRAGQTRARDPAGAVLRGLTLALRGAAAAGPGGVVGRAQRHGAACAGWARSWRAAAAGPAAAGAARRAVRDAAAADRTERPVRAHRRAAGASAASPPTPRTSYASARPIRIFCTSLVPS